MKELSEPLYRAFTGRVHKLGYTVVEPENKDQPAELFKDDQYIGFLLPNGAIYYKTGMGVEKEVHRLTDILLEMKPPYALYAYAAYLPFKGVEKYKMLCEFGDSLLAARLDDDGELQFVTWLYDYGHEGVRHTRYFDTDLAAAKQDFAVRCGLVDEKRVFSDKELAALYDACVYRGKNDETLICDSGKLLQGLVEKLESLDCLEPEQESENELEV
ncbi:hypothetical protein [Dehalobacter restrictus]|jgi:hypothetical protein|uniref:hypothetical protein n=1 Tax=Dehalobacter restrictus TaxID=55583 RepID=UPI00338E55FC